MVVWGLFALCFRSPSPEPIYSTDGKRLNTRENRMRKKLEEERHKLIQRLQELNPDYRPPADYRCVQNRAVFMINCTLVNLPQNSIVFYL